MNGNAQKLIKYLDGASKRFIIPVYQRNYDWKMEHCKQLYDDLVKIIRQNRKSHFFGSIVSVQSESGTMEEFLIIDGQQRLTTISLLLLAIYHLLSSGKMVSRDHQLTDKILKKYLIDEYEPEEKRIKLKPIKNDQKAFGILFDQDEEYIPDSNLTINYRYFYDRIQHGELDIDELFDATDNFGWNFLRKCRFHFLCQLVRQLRFFSAQRAKLQRIGKDIIKTQRPGTLGLGRENRDLILHHLASPCGGEL